MSWNLRHCFFDIHPLALTLEVFRETWKHDQGGPRVWSPTVGPRSLGDRFGYRSNGPRRPRRLGVPKSTSTITHPPDPLTSMLALRMVCLL